MSRIFLLGHLIFSLNSFASPIQLNIKLKHNNHAERRAQKLLEDSTAKYDLSRDIFTHDIIIETRATPHSHPILTLNTRTVDDPSMYLATFVHEQIHWFFAARETQTDKFVELMKIKFPNAPVGDKNGGAKDEFSTYLHLGVCYYEYQEAIRLFGPAEAKRIFETNVVYTWIRNQVLANAIVIAKGLEDADLVWR